MRFIKNVPWVFVAFSASLATCYPNPSAFSTIPSTTVSWTTTTHGATVNLAASSTRAAFNLTIAPTRAAFNYTDEPTSTTAALSRRRHPPNLMQELTYRPGPPRMYCHVWYRVVMTKFVLAGVNWPTELTGLKLEVFIPQLGDLLGDKQYRVQGWTIRNLPPTDVYEWKIEGAFIPIPGVKPALEELLRGFGAPNGGKCEGKDWFLD